METHKKNVDVSGLIILLLGVAATVTAFIFTPKLFGEDSIFNKNISNHQVVNSLFHFVPSVIRTIQIITIAVLAFKLLGFIVSASLRGSNRAITISKLLNSFMKWIIAIIALLAVLGAWGVNTGTLLASAGILTLVVGLGSQSLVADIVAGLFIVFESEYIVGDIVIIDNWRGTVKEIGIRTTKVIDAGGNVKIINNSEIKTIINQTQELSLAKCVIGTEYGDSLERIEIVIKNNLDPIRKAIPAIVEGPFYKGVTALSASSVDLLFVATCKEEDLFQVQRDLNREVKLMFDRNNINVPFPQIVVNKPEKIVDVAIPSAEAAAFVKSQKELSSIIVENEDGK